MLLYFIIVIVIFIICLLYFTHFSTGVHFLYVPHSYQQMPGFRYPSLLSSTAGPYITMIEIRSRQALVDLECARWQEPLHDNLGAIVKFKLLVGSTKRKPGWKGSC